jgi:hypothetical protein
VPTYRPYVPQVVTIPDGSDVSPIIQFADKAALGFGGSYWKHSDIHYPG